MEIRQLTTGDAATWDGFVNQHPRATIFHRFGWKRVIEDTMQYPADYLMASDNEQITGVYPLFIMKTRLFGTMGTSLPFLGYGGIVANNIETEKALMAKADDIARTNGCAYIELRQRYPLETNLPTTDRKTTSLLSVNANPEDVFKRLHSNVRNKIRKADKNGVVVHQGTAHLPEFYDVYARNLRDLGTPVIAKQFFEAIAREFPHLVRIYRATHNRKTIGAKFVLMDQDTCYFTWSATLREALSNAPVHAMNWKAIEEACAAGCKSVDFGRSTSQSTHADFKKYWNVESQVLPWSYQLISRDTIPGLNKENKKLSGAIALWRHLPLRLSRFLGPPIARQLP